MKPRITLITLGVNDLEKALAFYRDGLGFPTQGIVGTEFEHGAVAFFDMQSGLKLALWPRRDIAHDAGIPESPPSGTEVAIAHNVGSEKEVDAIMEQVRKAGAKKPNRRKPLSMAAMPGTSRIRMDTCGKSPGIPNSRCPASFSPSTLDDVFSYECSQRILISHARHNAEVGMKVCAGILLISAGATAPLRAQDTTSVTPDSTIRQVTPAYRSPKRALILGSVIPGAGHIYSGEYWRGFWTYQATIGGIGLGAWTFIVDRCTFSFLSTTRCDPGPEWPHQVLGVTMVGIGIWEWISSARDAPHAAERANAKHIRNAQRPQPIIQPPADSHSGWRVGAEIHF